MVQIDFAKRHICNASWQLATFSWRQLARSGPVLKLTLLGAKTNNLRDKPTKAAAAGIESGQTRRQLSL
jgi:hypothetical protein